MTNQQVLFMNQFPSGTMIKLMDFVRDAEGLHEYKHCAYLVTRVQDEGHNNFWIYGKYLDNQMLVAGDERVIGVRNRIADQLVESLKLPYSEVNNKDLYKNAVEAGIIIPSDGPLIKAGKGYCYNHFPKGTLFKVKRSGVATYDDIRKDKVFEVVSIVINGPGSFVLKTTTHSKEIYGEHSTMDFNYATNIDQVGEIIKRGDGDVVFDERDTYSGSKLRLVRDLRAGTHKHKTNYVHFDEFGIIREASRKVPLPIGSILDMEAFSQALKKQTFFKKNWYARTTNRKRTDRWVKQNINRFLMTITEARKQEQEFYADMYKSDYDD